MHFSIYPFFLNSLLPFLFPYFLISFSLAYFSFFPSFFSTLTFFSLFIPFSSIFLYISLISSFLSSLHFLPYQFFFSFFLSSYRVPFSSFLFSFLTFFYFFHLSSLLLLPSYLYLSFFPVFVSFCWHLRKHFLYHFSKGMMFALLPFLFPNHTHTFQISSNQTHIFMLNTNSPIEIYTLTHILTPQSPSNTTDRETNSGSERFEQHQKKKRKNSKTSQDLK